MVKKKSKSQEKHSAAGKSKITSTSKDKPVTKKAAAKTTSKIKAVAKVKLVTRQTADEMVELLCKRYPDADCELTFENDYQLLTSVILSAQTTDVQVNKVTPHLFKHYPTAKSWPKRR